LTIAATALGLWLRIEHAFTFDGPGRGADYAVHLSGVRWMAEHWRAFNLDATVNYQVRSYPPLWYAVSAVILKVTHSEQAIASLAVLGWMVRHCVLFRMLKEGAPGAHWASCAALSIHAVLPLSILIDGKVNPEGLHAGLFMVALYALWRMERQASQSEGISVRTAVTFGVFAGLALLTKATAAVLVVAGALVLAWRAVRLLRSSGWATTWRRLLRGPIAGLVVWLLIVGWWCGPNLVKHGHPFPHMWDLEGPEQHAELALPLWERRPVAWLLPFEWREYLELPVVRSPAEPTPNFWAANVAGTWSDYYNRGFCRLSGGEVTDRVWGARGGALWDGTRVWNLSYRCVDVFVRLVYVGLWLSLASVLGILYTAISHVRTAYSRGSLVVPATIVLGVFFVMLFALTYPFDGTAVLNPRYLLPQAAPISFCLGLGLARLQELTRRRGVQGALAALVSGFTLLAIGVIAVLVVFERFGS
jgi:hypothetical protein